eukprot:gene2189-4259_t
MGFQFGAVYSISSATGTSSMIAIVVFLVFFEYVTDAVELLEEGSPATYKMIQKVFKELMIMGLVSFLIVMFDTTQYAEEAHSVVLALDYCHILLFFVALYFVFQSFLLIRLSDYLAMQYEKFHFAEISAILSEYKSLNHTNFLKYDNLRRGIEFKTLGIFFHQSFKLPYDFGFSDYLTVCFEKYALRLLDIGPFTWASVIILALINYGRVIAMKNMDLRSDDSCTLSRSGSHDVVDTSHNTTARYLASTGLDIDPHCADFDLKVFLTGGAMLTGFVIILLIVSRIYELRLLKKAGAINLQACVVKLEGEAKRLDDLKQIAETNMTVMTSATPDRRNSPVKIAVGKLSTMQLKRNIAILQQEETKKKKMIQRQAFMVLLATKDTFLGFFYESFTTIKHIVRKTAIHPGGGSGNVNERSLGSLNASTTASMKPSVRALKQGGGGSGGGSKKGLGASSVRSSEDNDNTTDGVKSPEKSVRRTSAQLPEFEPNNEEKQNVNLEMRLEADLNSIYLFGQKDLYFNVLTIRSRSVSEANLTLSSQTENSPTSNP